MRSKEGLPGWFGWWLCVLFLMVLVMMQVGAVTRLTDSGLSMVEWRPFVGMVPPLSGEEWERIFSLYRETEEYRAYVPSLEEFKEIFWWEYIHRAWGRLIGIVSIVPLLWMWMRGELSSWWKIRLVVLVGLGGFQGFVGYWMVRSGFVDRVDVAPERLVIHLSLAMVILVLIGFLCKRFWWGEGGEREGGEREGSRGKWVVTLTCFWLVLLMVSGVLVAGLDGGFLYNSWPKMGSEWIAGDYGKEGVGVWGLLVDDRVSSQVHHRFLAYGALVCVCVQAYVVRDSGSVFVEKGSKVLVVLVLCQGVLGIVTLLSGVNVLLALLHQLGAVSVGLLGILIGIEVHFFKDVAGEVE